MDPVCGMMIDREKSVILDWMGKTYYFCASGCRDEFINHQETVTQ